MYYDVYKLRERILNFLTVFVILSAFVASFQTPSTADIFTETSEDYRLKGFEEQQKGNLDQALTYYLKAVTLGDGSAKIFNDIGVTYEHLGIDERAEEYYMKAIRTDPNYLPPYTNLAFLYQQHDKINEAIIFFRERYRLANRDDPWRARVVQELLRLDPSFREEFLQTVLEEAHAELARRRQEDLQLQMMRANNHYQRGLVFLQEKRYEEALNEFEQALILTPNNPKLVKGRDRALYGKRIQMIRRRFDDAIDEMETGHLESAKSIFQDILTIIPRKPVAEPE